MKKILFITVIATTQFLAAAASACVVIGQQAKTEYGVTTVKSIYQGCSDEQIKQMTDALRASGKQFMIGSDSTYVTIISKERVRQAGI